MPIDENIEFTISQFNPRPIKERRRNFDQYQNLDPATQFKFGDSGYMSGKSKLYQFVTYLPILDPKYPNYMSPHNKSQNINFATKNHNQSARHPDSYM